MGIHALLKKNPYTWDILLFLLFALFFLFSPDRFSLFGLNLQIESGLPLLFVLVIYLKTLFTFALNGSIKATIFFSVSVISLISLILFAYIIANKLAHYLERKSILKESSILGKIGTKYIIIALFIISFSIRLYYISPGMFHHDTVKLAMAVEKTLDTGIIQPTVSKNYGLVTLNAFFYAIPHYLFGATKSIMTLNFTSVLFGSLAVVMLFLFAKELFNKYAAIAAALAFSFNPVFLSISTHGKDHAHVAFFILLAGWSLLKALDTDKNFYKILFGLSVGFGMFIRFTSILSLVPFGLIYLFSKNSGMQRFSLRNILKLAIPLLIFLTAIFYTEYDTIIGQKEANEFLSFANFNSTLLILFLRAFTPLGLFLTLYGFARMFKERRKESLILILWAFVTFIFFSSFVSLAARFFTDIYITGSIFIGYGIFHLSRKFGNLPLLVLIALVIASFVSIQPILSYRSNHAPGNDLVSYMESITEKNALIVDYGDYLPYYEYASSRSVISCPITDDLNKLEKDIGYISSQTRPVYVSQSCFAFGTEEQKKRLLAAIKEKLLLKEVGQIEVDDFHKSEVMFDKSTYKVFGLVPLG